LRLQLNQEASNTIGKKTESVYQHWRNQRRRWNCTEYGGNWKKKKSTQWKSIRKYAL